MISVKDSILKISAVFFLVIFIGYFLIVKTEIDQYSKLKNQAIMLHHSVEIKQKQSGKLDNYRNQVKTLETQFATLANLFTTKQQIPQLLEHISNTAQSRRLMVESVSPLPEIEYDFYTQFPVVFSVMGTYQQITGFLILVTQMDSLVTLHDFNLTRERSDHFDDQLLLKITMKIHANKNSSEHSKLPVESYGHNPFKQSMGAVRQESLDAMHFVGVLKQGTRIWALMSGSDGLISKVQIGDYLGEEHGRVVFIHDDAIEIEKIIRRRDGIEKKLLMFKLRH